MLMARVVKVGFRSTSFYGGLFLYEIRCLEKSWWGELRSSLWFFRKSCPLELQVSLDIQGLVVTGLFCNGSREHLSLTIAIDSVVETSGKWK